MSEDTTLYFRGVPTKPDVDMLVRKYGVPAEGTVIGFVDIADCIGVPVDSSRFRTVVHSWRRLLIREHNVLLVAEGDKTFKAANPEERMRYASGKIAGGRKAIGRAIVVAHGTDAKRLTEASQKVRASICSMNETKMRLMLGVQPKT